MAQPWRGNVRELEHVLLNAWIMSDADELGPEDFELPVLASPYREPKLGVVDSSVREDPSAQSVLEKSKLKSGRATGTSAKAGASKARKASDERELILEALRTCDHNKVKAAQLIGIPRRTFYRRLEAYGIK